MIIFNTNATFCLDVWCLCGNHIIRSGDSPRTLKKVRWVMKHNNCPKCGALWMAFKIRRKDENS